MSELGSTKHTDDFIRVTTLEELKEKHGQRPSSKGCGESALAQGTYHIERTLRRLSLLHSSRKSLLEGQ